MNIKRYLVAGAAAATLAGGAFAFAASLDVSSSTLASGDTSVDSGCNALSVDWSPSYDGASHAYLIDDITVTGSPACAGEVVEVTIDRDGALSNVVLTEAFDTSDPDALPDPIVDAAPFAVTFADVDLDAADVLHVTAISTGADVD